MQPKVSVIVPVYQVIEYLPACLDSILSQTYPQLEILIIDDGSTDGSAAVCDEYLQKDPRIRVLHKENGGLSSARNAGIDLCSGDYVTFIDSDDIVAPEMVADMVALALQEQADVVKIGVIRKYHEAECIPARKDFRTVSGRKALKMLFTSNSQIVCGCGKLFRRSLFDSLRFPLGRCYEDEYLTPRTYLCSSRIVLSDSEYYFYMQRDNDSILRGAITAKKAEDVIWVSEDRIALFRAHHLPFLTIQAKIDYYFRLRSVQKKSEQAGLTELLQRIREKQRHFGLTHPVLVLYIRLRSAAYRLYSFLRKSIRK